MSLLRTALSQATVTSPQLGRIQPGGATYMWQMDSSHSNFRLNDLPANPNISTPILYLTNTRKAGILQLQKYNVSNSSPECYRPAITHTRTKSTNTRYSCIYSMKNWDTVRWVVGPRWMQVGSRRSGCSLIVVCVSQQLEQTGPKSDNIEIPVT